MVSHYSSENWLIILIFLKPLTSLVDTLHPGPGPSPVVELGWVNHTSSGRTAGPPLLSLGHAWAPLSLLFWNGRCPLKMGVWPNSQQVNQSRRLILILGGKPLPHSPGHAEATLKRMRHSKNSTIQKCKEFFNDSILAKLKSGLRFADLAVSQGWIWDFHFLSNYYVPNTGLSDRDKRMEKERKKQA